MIKTCHNTATQKYDVFDKNRIRQDVLFSFEQPELSKTLFSFRQKITYSEQTVNVFGMFDIIYIFDEN